MFGKGPIINIETDKLEMVQVGIEEVERMLKALIKSVKKHSTP